MSVPADCFVEDARAGAVIRIRVTPKASRARVAAGPDWLTVAVHSPAEKGKATEEALRAVADFLGLKRGAVSLQAGATSRGKRVLVLAATPSDLRKRVAERLGVLPEV